MYRPALIGGIVGAALAVILGAFGAHKLKELVDATQLAIYEKGVSYQFYHSFALLATGILYSAFPNKLLRWASSLFVAGIVLFSGSLYLMVGLATSGGSIGAAGVITPIGGLCFILGWIMLLLGVLKRNH
ncbi:MAG: DUF423 domain-containing protein [Bacteroidetes bacterium]|nr:DUF423 domain-containing protein [Bacteroidota bacterium]